MTLPPYEDLISLPWETGSNGPATYNCWGLIRELYRRAGHELPDLNAAYRGEMPDATKVFAEVQALPFVEVITPESGDLVLIKRDGEI